MIFLIITISLSFYFKYFNKTDKNLKKNKVIEKININQNDSSTYIDNINYISSDSKGNKYQITAKKAEIDVNDSDVMFLENIIAYIFVKDSDVVKITSDFGKYNSKNYDTIFSKNVIITYLNHKLTGDYFDFSIEKNLGTMSRNIIYKDLVDDTIMKADRFEINLITKDSMIFMNSLEKQVIITGKNKNGNN